MSEQATKKVCLVIGVGDGVGAAIAKAFALDGFETVITRRARNLPDLEAIAQKIRDQGGVVHARGVDARSEEETIALFQEIERDIGPIEVLVFNIGANVRFAIEATTARVFTKVWEMACFAGFLAGREAAKVMVPPIAVPSRPPPVALSPSSAGSAEPIVWPVDTLAAPAIH